MSIFLIEFDSKIPSSHPSPQTILGLLMAITYKVIPDVRSRV